MTPELLQVEAWARYPWLRAAFSTRLGGASAAYGVHELNLGWTREDAPEVVAANRAHVVLELFGAGADELITVRQVHGAQVRCVRGAGPWQTAEGRAVLEGDGLLCAEPGRLLGVQTADCVPVLLVDTRLRAVGALHAGWRGTVAGIAAAGVARMRQEYGSRAEDLVAAIGPCIRRCCFEVGQEVVAAFAMEAYADRIIERGAGWARIDLQEANRQQLLAAGVSEAAITVLAECTVCTRTIAGGRRYFSHRAERGVTGRMMSLIGVLG